MDAFEYLDHRVPYPLAANEPYRDLKRAKKIDGKQTIGVNC